MDAALPAIGHVSFPIRLISHTKKQKRSACQKGIEKTKLIGRLLPKHGYCAPPPFQTFTNCSMQPPHRQKAYARLTLLTHLTHPKHLLSKLA
jgi:hypothetical protein